MCIRNRPAGIARCVPILTLLLLGAPMCDALAQGNGTGSLGGSVVSEDGRPLGDASVELRIDSSGAPRTARSDSLGRFRVAGLTAGRYRLAVRRLGFVTAALEDVRISDRRQTEVRIVLTQSARQLSTVTVLTTMLDVDPTRTELVQRFAAEDVVRLPLAREAGALVALVPGARVGQLWGGAGQVTNSFQLDGITMSHPGGRGDFLRPSVDWIESVDILGLGAGAAHGDFQGGLINATTKSGGTVFSAGARFNVEAAGLTASNFNIREEGIEQAGRREASAEAGGPLYGERLRYFVAGQAVQRDQRVADVRPGEAARYREPLIEGRDLRGFGKLTWLPRAGARVDAMLGTSIANAEHFGLTGSDDVGSTQRVRAPAVFHELAWRQQLTPQQSVDLRIGGYTATERRDGYAGGGVPGVRVIALAREPGYQNADFNERLDPASLSVKGNWERTATVAGTSNRTLLGFEITGGRWEQELRRNGGMTWRPFPDIDTREITPLDPTTWEEAGSEWGGEIQLKARTRTEAVFVEQEMSLGPRVTLTNGLRFSRWKGTLRGDSISPSVAANAFSPRIGIAWDLLGTGQMVAKAHWGRYHQGMSAPLFDRIAGTSVYSSERIYYEGPTVADPRQTLTEEERDQLFIHQGTGQPFTSVDYIFDETGRVEDYRQPYVDQLVISLERSIGSRWKAEVALVERRNRNIVGLVDRNLATNYTPVRDIYVDQRYSLGYLRHPSGGPLFLPVVWVNNEDLRIALEQMRAALEPPPPGFSYDTIATLTWDPDLVYTTIPEANRSYRQGYLSVRTVQPRFNAQASLTWTRLVGNTGGVATAGGQRSGFSAGPWVRPNEGGPNLDGHLGDYAEMEAKAWVTTRLPWGIEGGATFTRITGERLTPTFMMESGRYRFLTAISDGAAYPARMFRSLSGQQMLLEPRGQRHYGDRTILDLHAERRFELRGRTLVASVDVFNALASNEITEVKSVVDDEFLSDPTTAYGSPRRRVAPRTVRLGMNLLLGARR